MNKSILVIDTPKSCDDCPLKYVHTRKDSWYCCLTDIEVEYECNMEIIDKNCPLKPIPEKKEFPVYYALGEFDKEIGYNKCIDDILGEEE